MLVGTVLTCRVRLLYHKVKFTTFDSLLSHGPLYSRPAFISALSSVAQNVPNHNATRASILDVVSARALYENIVSILWRWQVALCSEDVTGLFLAVVLSMLSFL